MTDPILKITDGTGGIEFDLLNSTYGLSLNSWRQQLINFKNGGTYRDNPLADQRRLVDTKWANAIETLTVKDKNVDVDTLIEATQNLLRLLEKAVDYWTTDWQNTPVFLVARAACETNARYALIVNYRLPDLPSPYEQPFLQPGGEPVWDDYDIILEREHWTKNQPGTGTAVPISATEDYNGVSFGNVDTSGTREPTTAEGEVYIANKRNVANLTHIFVDDGGVFSANLLGSAPYNLLPTPAIAVNDAVYFICDTTVSDSGPFSNVVFDIGTAGAGYTGAVWEIWTGAAWANLSGLGEIYDNTDPGAGARAFDRLGVNMVTIDMDGASAPNWTTTIINGITGYALRLRITGVFGAYTPPQQQNRDVYSTVWPYVEIQAAALGGDIPPVARMRSLAESANDISAEALRLAVNRQIFGIRSVSRGENFTAYINLSDEQNPSGVTVSVGADTSFVSDTFAPSGRKVLYQTGAPSSTFTTRATIAIDDTIISEYYGRYRALLRVVQATGSEGDIVVRLNYQVVNTTIGAVTFVEEFSNSASPGVTALGDVLDFGLLEIPLTSLVSTSDIVDEFRINIQTTHTSTTPDLEIYDIILMPIDEWSGDFIGKIDTFGYYPEDPGTDDSQYLDVDSVSRPKSDVRAFVRKEDDDNIVDIWQIVSDGRFTLQPNTRHRVWFTAMLNDTSGQFWKPHTSLSIRLTANQRYLNMRGER